MVLSLTTLVSGMGATFGGMLASGVKAAKEALKLYESYKIVDGEVVA